MSSLNRASLIGNLGKDPEVRTLNNGNPVVSFSVATSERWKDKATGEKKEATEWHDVVIYNEALCKVAESYLRKGSKVFVEGKIQRRKWTDAQGQERQRSEIVLQGFGGTLTLLDRAEGGGPPLDDQRETNARPAPERQASAPASRASALDDDIPF